MIYNGLPLARGDTDGESIAQLFSVNVIPQSFYWESYLKRTTKIPAFVGMTNEHCLLASCLVGSSPPLGKPPTGFSETDVGEPPDVECDVGRVADETTSFEIDATKLTGAQNCYGCELTMEQVLSERNRPPDWDSGKNSLKVGNRYREACKSFQSPQVRDVSISWMTGQIHNAVVEDFGNDEMKQKDLDRLQLEVGEPYSNRLLSSRSFADPPRQYLMGCDSMAVNDFTGPPLSWRYRYWYYDYGWQNNVLPIPLSAGFWAGLSAGCLAEWESNVVESVRLILQRWSRVNSFSSTICCTCEKSEHEIVQFLYTGENKST
jgi:hypothetical protein